MSKSTLGPAPRSAKATVNESIQFLALSSVTFEGDTTKKVTFYDSLCTFGTFLFRKQ